MHGEVLIVLRSLVKSNTIETYVNNEMVALDNDHYGGFVSQNKGICGEMANGTAAIVCSKTDRHSIILAEMQEDSV